jgi:hypothetical protein
VVNWKSDLCGGDLMEIKMSYEAMEKIVTLELRDRGFDITDIKYNHPFYASADIDEALEYLKITYSVELQVQGEGIE